MIGTVLNMECVALSALAGRMAPVLKRHVQTLNKITAILFGGSAAKLVID